MNIEMLLNEREKTHGSYGEQSRTAQLLKRRMRMMPNWERMPAYMHESLEMIATKIARLGHGDYGNVDSAVDISGYAELMAREMRK